MASQEQRQFLADLRTDPTLRALWLNWDTTARKAYLTGRLNFSLEELNQLDLSDSSVTTLDALDAQISIAHATAFWGAYRKGTTMATLEERLAFIRDLRTDPGLRAAWKYADHNARKAILRQRPTFTDADVDQMDTPAPLGTAPFYHPPNVSDTTLDAEIDRAEAETYFWG